MSANSGSFRKGMPNNPAGKSKRAEGFREACRDITVKNLPKIAAWMNSITVDKVDKMFVDTWSKVKSAGFGSDPQAIELTGKDGGPIQSEKKYSETEIATAYAAFLAKQEALRSPEQASQTNVASKALSPTLQ